jgi:hypothetical protein
VAESPIPGEGHAERVVLSHPRQEKGDEQADADRAGDYVGRGPPADRQLMPAQEQSAKTGDGAAGNPEIEPVDPDRMEVIRGGGRPPRVVPDPKLGEHAVRVNLHGHSRGEVAKAHTEPTQGKPPGELRARKGCKTSEDGGDEAD